MREREGMRRARGRPAGGRRTIHAPRISAGLALLLAGGWLVLSCAGCSGRERTNPFDPLNDETGGLPVAASAVAGCERVDLRWHDLDMRDLRGSRIWRRPDGGATAESLLTPAPLGATVREFADTSARNNIAYAYRVEYRFSGDSAFCAPVTARPGAALPWLADACGWGLTRLSADGGSVIASESYGSAILDLDIDAAGRRLFAAQIDSGQVLVYSRSGERLAALASAGASCVSWSAGAQALAIGAFYESRVDWRTLGGDTLASLDLEGAHPEDVSFRDAGTTWIALREGRLLRVALDPFIVDSVAAACEWPVAIADDPAHGCWVADRGGALFYVRDKGGSAAALAGSFVEPLDVDAAGDGTCWVADRSRRSVVQVDRDCVVLDERVVGPVAGVTYDPQSHALWCALPEPGEVLFLSLRDGWERRRFVGGCPRKIAGDWTGGCEGR